MKVESHPWLLESAAQEVVVSQHRSLSSKLAVPGEEMLTEPKLPASSRVRSNQWLVGEFKGPVLCIQGDHSVVAFMAPSYKFGKL